MREKLKLYYCCRFTQLSPLRLSGGKNDRTDNDLMLDSRGLPMIPGSALAGVLRGRLTREEANLLFGRDFWTGRQIWSCELFTNPCAGTFG